MLLSLILAICLLKLPYASAQQRMPGSAGLRIEQHRRLLQSRSGSEQRVDTPEQLLEELVKGTTHIVITKHLNFTAARTGNAGDSDDPVLDIPDVVRSIQGLVCVCYAQNVMRQDGFREGACYDEEIPVGLSLEQQLLPGQCLIQTFYDLFRITRTAVASLITSSSTSTVEEDDVFVLSNLYLLREQRTLGESPTQGGGFTTLVQSTTAQLYLHQMTLDGGRVLEGQTKGRGRGLHTLSSSTLAVGTTFANFEADQGAAWLAVPAERTAPYGAATIAACKFLQNAADIAGPALHISQRQTVSLLDTDAPVDTNVILASSLFAPSAGSVSDVATGGTAGESSGGEVGSEGAAAPASIDDSSDYEYDGSWLTELFGDSPDPEPGPTVNSRRLRMHTYTPSLLCGTFTTLERATELGCMHAPHALHDSSVHAEAAAGRNILQVSPSADGAAVSMIVEASATPGDFLERSRVYAAPEIDVKLVGVPGHWKKVATALNETDPDTEDWFDTPEVVRPPQSTDQAFQDALEAMQEAHRKLITYRGGPAPPGASALKGKHIAGIVCGALVLLVATGILVWYFRCCGFCAKPKDSESEASATKKPAWTGLQKLRNAAALTSPLRARSPPGSTCISAAVGDTAATAACMTADELSVTSASKSATAAPDVSADAAFVNPWQKASSLQEFYGMRRPCENLDASLDPRTVKNGSHAKKGSADSSDHDASVNHPRFTPGVSEYAARVSSSDVRQLAIDSSGTSGFGGARPSDVEGSMRNSDLEGSLGAILDRTSEGVVSGSPPEADPSPETWAALHPAPADAVFAVLQHDTPAGDSSAADTASSRGRGSGAAGAGVVGAAGSAASSTAVVSAASTSAAAHTPVGNNTQGSEQFSELWITTEIHTFVDVTKNPANAAREVEVLTHTLDLLAARGAKFLDRFVLDSAAARFRGGQGIVQFARDANTGEECAIKFFTHEGAFAKEKQLYEHADARLQKMMAAVKHLEPNADQKILMAPARPFPPCIVVEKGESLDAWATHVRPSFIAIWQVLSDLMQLLAAMHDTGTVHRDLKPANVLWRPRVHEWTLIDFGCAADIGSEAPLMLSLAYAPPEVVNLYARSVPAATVSSAQDIWALGVMAFELLTRTVVFPPFTPKAEILKIMAGEASLPWEGSECSAVELRARLGRLENSVLRCLSRDPKDRPTAVEILQEWDTWLNETNDIFLLPGQTSGMNTESGSGTPNGARKDLLSVPKPSAAPDGANNHITKGDDKDYVNASPELVALSPHNSGGEAPGGIPFVVPPSMADFNGAVLSSARPGAPRAGLITKSNRGVSLTGLELPVLPEKPK